jgi:hypothetical protein
MGMPHKNFMFELTKEEFQNWRSQFVTSKGDRMGLRYKPMVFTEQGVAMLSSVLNSQRAVEVNIAIIRAFVHLRRMISTHSELARMLKKLEERLDDHDEKILVIFEAIKKLIEDDEKPKKKIGYIKEGQAKYCKKSRKK